MNKRPFASALAFLLAFALALPLALKADTAPEKHHGVGVVKGIEKGGKVLVIQHEAIPGFMEAMTMPFELADPALAKGVKVGDHVRFTIVHKGDFWPIVALKKFTPKASGKSGSASPAPATTMAPMDMKM